MSKKNTKKGSRSRRKPARDREGEVSRVDGDGQRVTVQLSLPIAEIWPDFTAPSRRWLERRAC